MRFEILTAMKIHIVVIWVVMSYDNVVGYQHFRGPCCLHFHGATGILPHHYKVSQTRRPQL